MKTSVPFTAFCPECNGHRTFTIIGLATVGCCVCGTTERDAFSAVSDRMQDDRATIGEIAARLNTLDGEVTELRDEYNTLAGRLARHQDKAVLTDVSALCAICNRPLAGHYAQFHAFEDPRTA